jgi:hypothetical protein
VKEMLTILSSPNGQMGPIGMGWGAADGGRGGGISEEVGGAGAGGLGCRRAPAAAPLPDTGPGAIMGDAGLPGLYRFDDAGRPGEHHHGLAGSRDCIRRVEGRHRRLGAGGAR